MTFEQWAAAIPEQLTARDALRFIELALTDARAAVVSVEARFTGTVPPPPWPKHPELQQAIDAMEGGRLMMNQAISLGHGDTPQAKASPYVQRLIAAGRNLYAQSDVMVNAKGTDAAELAARAAAAAGGLALKAAGTSAGGLLLLGALMWWAWRSGDA